MTDEAPTHRRIKPEGITLLAGNPVVAAPHPETSEAQQINLGAAVLGSVMSLLFRSNFHRQRSLEYVRQTFLTPIAYNQFILHGRGSAPYALATWAWLTQESEQKLLENTEVLSPEEWRGGGRLWIMDLVAPFGGGSWLAADFRDRVALGPTEAYAIRRRRDGSVGRVACFKRSDDETWLEMKYGRPSERD